MGPKEFIEELSKLIKWFEDNCGDEADGNHLDGYSPSPSKEFECKCEHAKEYLDLLEKEING